MVSHLSSRAPDSIVALFFDLQATCCSRINEKRVVFYMDVCRIMAVIAGVFYWRGAELNAPGTRGATFAGSFYEKCLVIRGGVFVRAAVLSLVATSLAIKSCVLLRAPAVEGGACEPKPDGQNPPEAGVAVGLPQWPAQGYGQAPYPQGYGQARV